MKKAKPKSIPPSRSYDLKDVLESLHACGAITIKDTNDLQDIEECLSEMGLSLKSDVVIKW